MTRKSFVITWSAWAIFASVAIGGIVLGEQSHVGLIVACAGLLGIALETAWVLSR